MSRPSRGSSPRPFLGHHPNRVRHCECTGRPHGPSGATPRSCVRRLAHGASVAPSLEGIVRYKVQERGRQRAHRRVDKPPMSETLWGEQKRGFSGHGPLRRAPLRGSDLGRSHFVGSRCNLRGSGCLWSAATFGTSLRYGISARVRAGRVSVGCDKGG